MLINRDNPPAGHNPGYMPLKAAAQWAGVSVRTIKRWINRGLPRYQAGPRERVLIRPMDIDTFLERKQVPQLDIRQLAEETYRELMELG
jgi:hypothetical protein